MTVTNRPFSRQTVAVTGASGLIGRQLVTELLREGAEVWAIDRMTAPARAAHPMVHEVAYDLMEPTFPWDAVAGCKWIFHLASNTENRADRASRDEAVIQSIQTTTRLLDHIQGTDAGQRLVFTSSQLVYGRPECIASEESVPCPLNDFAAGKLATEAFLCAHASTHGLPIAVARLSNVIGPGGQRGIVHDFVEQVRSGDQYISVLGDGSQERNYLHVSDCARALLTLADHMPTGFSITNISGDTTLSAAGVASIVSDCAGLPDGSVRTSVGVTGWRGDSGTLRISAARLHGYGWRAELTSEEAVYATATAYFERVL